MQPQWAHQWRYDANGQPYVKVMERWWRLQRPPGSHALVTFFDVQNQYRPGLQYVYTAPNDWPLDEVCPPVQCPSFEITSERCRLTILLAGWIPPANANTRSLTLFNTLATRSYLMRHWYSVSNAWHKCIMSLLSALVADF